MLHLFYIFKHLLTIHTENTYNIDLERLSTSLEDMNILSHLIQTQEEQIKYINKIENFVDFIKDSCIFDNSNTINDINNEKYYIDFIKFVINTTLCPKDRRNVIKPLHNKMFNLLLSTNINILKHMKEYVDLLIELSRRSKVLLKYVQEVVPLFILRSLSILPHPYTVYFSVSIKNQSYKNQLKKNYMIHKTVEDTILNTDNYMYYKKHVDDDDDEIKYIDYMRSIYYDDSSYTNILVYLKMSLFYLNRLIVDSSFILGDADISYNEYVQAIITDIYNFQDKDNIIIFSLLKFFQHLVIKELYIYQDNDIPFFFKCNEFSLLITTMFDYCTSVKHMDHETKNSVEIIWKLYKSLIFEKYDSNAIDMNEFVLSLKYACNENEGKIILELNKKFILRKGINIMKWIITKLNEIDEIYLNHICYLLKVKNHEFIDDILKEMEDYCFSAYWCLISNNTFSSKIENVDYIIKYAKQLRLFILFTFNYKLASTHILRMFVNTVLKDNIYVIYSSLNSHLNDLPFLEMFFSFCIFLLEISKENDNSIYDIVNSILSIENSRISDLFFIHQFFHDHISKICDNIRNFPKNTKLDIIRGEMNLKIIKKVKITIKRDDIIESTINALRSPLENYKPLGIVKFKIIFMDEIGIDEEGLTKEWLTLLFDEFSNLNFGMLDTISNTNDYHPRIIMTPSEYYISLFTLMGQIMAICVVKNYPIKIDLPIFMFKKLLNQSVDINDFKRDFSNYYNNLCKCDISDLECFTFNIINLDSKLVEIELVDNGKNIFITDDNFNEYINCVSDIYMNKGVNLQIEAWKKGIFSVIESKYINDFSPEELKFLFSGDKITTPDEIIKRIDIGKSINNQEFEYLKKFISNIDKTKLSLFIKQITSMPYLKSDDMIKVARLATKVDNSDIIYLPKTSTCSNTLLIPYYKDYESFENAMNILIYDVVEFGNA
ncbi:E3 ubiquitin-protein ligase TOM1-like [Astathelohania contejeani]|uniref:HECT-type E3 ubiquitin transferase n=1 Tax=Astathelohania contejeani TaxID=164912 RepID=A0ABQ7I1L9_9MICR|nr:E3 ubiquitin-protein ligase TOM1-like [Thelohania contejeani]